MKGLLIFIFMICCSLEAKAQKNTIPSNNEPQIMDDFPDKPSFPGGETAFNKFLRRNLKWPDPNIDAQGKVFVNFDVEIDGRLTNFKVIKGMGEPFDKEALRVIKKSPKWIPAKQDGKLVKVRYVLPINFAIIK